jgi:hypothetical protein
MNGRDRGDSEPPGDARVQNVGPESMTVHDIGSKGLEEGARGTPLGGEVTKTRGETEFVNRNRRSVKCCEKRFSRE